MAKNTFSLGTDRQISMNLRLVQSMGNQHARTLGEARSTRGTMHSEEKSRSTISGFPSSFLFLLLCLYTRRGQRNQYVRIFLYQFPCVFIYLETGSSHWTWELKVRPVWPCPPFSGRWQESELRSSCSHSKCSCPEHLSSPCFCFKQGLEFLRLPQPSRSWDYRCMLPCLTFLISFLYNIISPA